jgi:hypothetical protein
VTEGEVAGEEHCGGERERERNRARGEGRGEEDLEIAGNTRD